MDAGNAIRLALRGSILLLIFSAGLHTEPRHATLFFREPRYLARMFISMFVVMPIVALVLSRGFALHPAVKIALVALALSPVPPILPRKAMKAGGAADYTIGLLVAASLISIPFVPMAMALLSRAYGATFTMPASVVAKVMLIGVLAPLAAGMIVRQFSRSFADRIATPAYVAAMLGLVISVPLIVFAARNALAALIGNGSVLAMVVFVTVGLVVGHALGGPNPDHRSVLALATSGRHPGLALAIAQQNFPKQGLAAAAIVICLIVGAVEFVPYARRMKRAT